MELRDIALLKIQLRKDIEAKINEFEARADVTVTSVSLDRPVAAMVNRDGTYSRFSASVSLVVEI